MEKHVPTNSKLASDPSAAAEPSETALDATCGFIKLKSPAYLTASSVCLRKVTGAAWSERYRKCHAVLPTGGSARLHRQPSTIHSVQRVLFV